MDDPLYRWIRYASIAVAVLAGLGALWFGMRSYGTYRLLQSAYEVGMPKASAIRGWMTLRYVGTTFRIPADELIARLDLPPTSLDSSLQSLAERQNKNPFKLVQEVQRIVAGITPPTPLGGESIKQGWLDRLNDQFLSALLRYGYAMLAVILLLGAIGVPVPAGLAATVAGSLSASGRLDWATAGAIAVTASFAGDIVTYGLGRSVSEPFLARRGHWLGLNAQRQAHARALFERWGAWTVLVTRTLVSHLSSVVSLLAGVSRYRLPAFLAIALVGRMLWTFAYMTLGYGIGNDLEAATDFLKNLSVVVVSLPVLLGSLLVATGRIKLGRTNGVDGAS